MSGHDHMHSPAERAPDWHDHVFLGAQHSRNERRLWLVIALTATMMVLEIGVGTWSGSMALVADGWHMSTHASALLIAALAYLYARRQARNPRFTFGTGKVGDLAGFASAIVLLLIALLMGYESLVRLLSPVAIAFDQAIGVASLGLLVNLASAWLLRHEDHHHHHHGHDHHHAHDHHHDHDHGHDHDHEHDHHDHHGHDNNLRAAYVHVLADAVTSVLAILALVCGRFFGWLWLDPVMGLVGGLVIANWSFSLIRASGSVLLDAVPEGEASPSAIRRLLEEGDDRVTDLHVWQVGPGHHAAIVAIASPRPREPGHYRRRLQAIAGLSHVTVEVNRAA